MITFCRQFGRGRHLTAAPELLFAAGLCTVQRTQMVCRDQRCTVQGTQMVCWDQPACTAYTWQLEFWCRAVGRLAPGDYSPQ